MGIPGILLLINTIRSRILHHWEFFFFFFRQFCDFFSFFFWVISTYICSRGTQRVLLYKYIYNARKFEIHELINYRINNRIDQ